MKIGLLCLVILWHEVASAQVHRRNAQLVVKGRSLPFIVVENDTTEAHSVVVIQHGFLRKGKHFGDLASKLASQGHRVLLPSFSFKNLRNESFVKPYLAALQKSGLVLNSQRETIPAVMVGHSLGALLATRFSSKASPWIKGLILLDPVDTPKNEIYSALKGLPVSLLLQVVVGKAGKCNKHSAFAKQIHTLPRDFVAVAFPTGSHCDAEGASSDLICRFMCGRSRPQDVERLALVVTQWVEHMLFGKTSGSWYPGGSDFREHEQEGMLVDLTARFRK